MIVKELSDYARGRPPGEVVAMIVDRMVESGLAPAAISRADSEMDSIRQALAWAKAGDLLLLITHSRRSGVVSYLQGLQARGWSAGDPVPSDES